MPPLPSASFRCVFHSFCGIVSLVMRSEASLKWTDLPSKQERCGFRDGQARGDSAALTRKEWSSTKKNEKNDRQKKVAKFSSPHQPKYALESIIIDTMKHSPKWAALAFDGIGATGTKHCMMVQINVNLKQRGQTCALCDSGSKRQSCHLGDPTPAQSSLLFLATLLGGSMTCSHTR